MNQAFVYCWTDHKTNKLYIGSHKGSIDDGYVCSSKYMMEEYKSRPEDFTRQIVATGKTEDIRKLECVLLQTLNAKIDENFYNKHNGDGLYFDGWGKGQHTEEHKKNMSIAASKRIRTTDHIEKLHEGRKKSKNSIRHNEAIRQYQTGRKLSLDTIDKIIKTKKLNNDTKKLASDAGQASYKKRKETGYYQSKEYKLVCAKGWETRRKKKEGLVNGN